MGGEEVKESGGVVDRCRNIARETAGSAYI